MSISFAVMKAEITNTLSERFGEQFDNPYHAADYIKEWLRHLILEWCEEKGLTAQVRLDLGVAYNWHPYNVGLGLLDLKNGPIVGIVIHYASIHNGKGAVSKRQKWLNKLTVNGSGNVVKHVARTDPDYLGIDLAEEFAEFIQSLQMNLVWELDLTNLESAV